MALLHHFWGVAAFLSLVVAAAAILRGYTGFGFGLFAVPLASTVLAPADAVPIVMALQLLSGIVTLRSDRFQVDRGSVALLLAAGLPFVLLGVLALGSVPPDAVRILIGVVTIAAAAALRIAGPAGTPVPSVMATCLAGAASGFLHGFVAMGGPPLTAFYLRGWFPPSVARASMTFVFSVLSIGPLAAALAAGMLTPRALAMVGLLTPALIAGTLAGGRIFSRYPHRHKAVATGALAMVGVVAVANGVL